MTATDELRKLLDERGVTYSTETIAFGGRYKPTYYTRWHSLNGCFCTFREAIELCHTSFTCSDCTPEQAVAATLGSGTCHDQAAPSAKRFCCSMCCTTDARKNPLFCHGCGRKVEQ